MRIRSDRIETDRVALFEAWGFFRARLRQQRGERKRGVQQSLAPMLEEILLEVKEGFETEGFETVAELRASVKFGRVSVIVRRTNGQEFEIVGKENEDGG